MDHLAHIRTESDAFLEACLDGGLDTPVPSCPDWTIADLLGHLGVVQRFHGGHLRRGVTDPPPGPRPTPPDTGLAQWFREGTDQLLETLAEVGTSTPAWNWSVVPEDATTAFWHRRMVHEAAVHRWDAQMARGRAQPIQAELARDGIDEVLHMWIPSRRDDMGPQGRVSVRLTDVSTDRVLVLGDASAGAVTISGRSSDVLLVLWGRMPLSDLDVVGDLELARAVRTG